MKVDKAVCTDTYEDLSRAIRFEAVFSTLVENKILAIKRECELKKRSKKSRVIRRILFGRKSSCKKGKNGADGKKRNGSVAGEARERCPGEMVEEEEEEEKEAIGAVGGGPLECSTLSDEVDEVIVEIGDLSSLVDADGNVVGVGTDYKARSESEAREVHRVLAQCREQDDDSSSGAIGGITLADELPSKSEAIAQSLQDDDRRSIKSNDGRFRERCGTLEPVSVSIEIEPHSDPLSTQYDMEDSGTNVSIELDVSEISDMKRSIASEPVPIIKNASKYRPSTTTTTTTGSSRFLGTASHRLRVLEAKSISAQNSPILPRQKSTEQPTTRHLTFSTATYQTAPPLNQSKKDIEDTSFVIDLSRDAGDASATSNHSNSNSNVIQSKDKPQAQADPSRRSSSHKKSALVVGDSSSSSASRKNKLNPVAAGGAASSGNSGGSAASSHHHHHHQKRFSDIVVYDHTPPPTPGLIESFNQLTAPNLPVISMRQSASPVSDMIKLHRLSSATAGSGAHGGRSNSFTVAQQQDFKQAPPSAAQPTTATTTIISESGGQSRKQRHGFLRQSSCDVELHYRPSGSGSHQRDKRSSCRSQRDSFSGGNRARMARDEDCADDPLMMSELNESDEEKLNKRKYSKYMQLRLTLDVQTLAVAIFPCVFRNM